MGDEKETTQTSEVGEPRRPDSIGSATVGASERDISRVMEKCAWLSQNGDSRSCCMRSDCGAMWNTSAQATAISR